MPNTTDPKWKPNAALALRERDLAERWSLSTRTLQRWRAEGFGPPFVRIGGSIRYFVQDVVAFEERQREDTGDGNEG